MPFLTFFTSPLFKWIAIIGVILGVVFGIYEKGYSSGENAQKAVYSLQQQKIEKVVVAKNEAVQAVADTTDKTIIVYRDRVVTKYKTITNNILTYENTPLASTILDASFVQLHDSAASAASDNQDSTSSATSGTNSNPTSIGTISSSPILSIAPVTTGEAIKVIDNNYSQYALCRGEVIAWNSFYQKVLSDVNK